MIYVYWIYEFIFSIIILFYYCFSGTPLLNVTPLHDPVEDLRTNTSSVWPEVLSHVSREEPVEKGHRATGNRKRINDVVFLFVWQTLQYLNYSLVFSFSFFCISSISCFWNLKLHEQSCDISFISIILIILSFVPL